jgi:hypothetical protein
LLEEFVRSRFRDFRPNKKDEMSKQVIHELAIATQQGKMTFPEVVKGLLEVKGVSRSRSHSPSDWKQKGRD